MRCGRRRSDRATLIVAITPLVTAVFPLFSRCFPAVFPLLFSLFSAVPDEIKAKLDQQLECQSTMSEVLPEKNA
jgi:hypothetical protein